jgi:acyl-CoA thioester hydrolase
MFDKYGADTLNNIFKMGEHSAKTTMKSTMIIETHITYNRELRLNDEVDINCIYFNHDDKKLHYKMEMIHKEKKYLASTIEIFAVYVDLKKRKVTGFEDEKIELMDDFIKKNKLNFNEKDLKFSSKLRK